MLKKNSKYLFVFAFHFLQQEKRQSAQASMLNSLCFWNPTSKIQHDLYIYEQITKTNDLLFLESSEKFYNKRFLTHHDHFDVMDRGPLVFHKLIDFFLHSF